MPTTALSISNADSHVMLRKIYNIHAIFPFNFTLVQLRLKELEGFPKGHLASKQYSPARHSDFRPMSLIPIFMVRNISCQTLLVPRPTPGKQREELGGGDKMSFGTNKCGLETHSTNFTYFTLDKWLNQYEPLCPIYNVGMTVLTPQSTVGRIKWGNNVSNAWHSTWEIDSTQKEVGIITMIIINFYFVISHNRFKVKLFPSTISRDCWTFL